MSATITHTAKLASASKSLAGKSFGPAPASVLSKLASAFWLVVDVIHEAREEERKAHHRSPFTAW